MLVDLDNGLQTFERQTSTFSTVLLLYFLILFFIIYLFRIKVNSRFFFDCESYLAVKII